jgi:hypothetical protein
MGLAVNYYFFPAGEWCWSLLSILHDESVAADSEPTKVRGDTLCLGSPIRHLRPSTVSSATLTFPKLPNIAAPQWCPSVMPLNARIVLRLFAKHDKRAGSRLVGDEKFAMRSARQRKLKLA